jgi:conjugative relaxase-like TrwC/TraI family protein
VLSPKTQTNLKNAKCYFEEHLSVGDYYSENERVSGEWAGEGATMLGLAGAVTRDEFLALCDNLHPKSGEQLTQRRNTIRRAEDREAANRRVFYDFTFSPPKSVSIASLVGGDKRIATAHTEAVKIALAELERFAATRIRGAKRNADRRTGNIVAALF